MQTTTRKPDKKSTKESKEETAKRQDEKLKRSVYTISTPRDFIQKSTTADIYAQKKKSDVQSVKAPKKAPGTTNTTSYVSPMKGLLKSSASSISQISRSEKTHVKRNEAKPSLLSGRKNEMPRKQPPMSNVTVNSPAAKRKLETNLERVAKSNKEVSSRLNEKSKERTKEISKQSVEVGKTKEVHKEPSKEIVKAERQRTKTRTLDENEVKVLKPDVVDNNAGMMSLSKKLAAQPKSFYIDLDEDKPKLTNDKSSDEEVSYEDDFESYESDFDSYHSDQTGGDGTSKASEQSERNEEMALVDDNSLKEGKDEEKMLDSGNFDLRDQRSAKSKPAVMDFILEDSEDRKTVSLTDEGFQDMSSGSASSSMRTSNRPLFLDFTKSKRNKIKRKVSERLKQRAKDLLGMITLHEMSYSLFEMQPISYDLYMATFGRSNYTQSGVQTFDNGITEEVQTEEVAVNQKWTQHPVEFSKNDIYINKDNVARKFSINTEDYLTKFTFLIKQNGTDQIYNTKKSDENYKTNPLRNYFEQKDGSGGDKILPYETYKSKLKSNDYNSNKLAKFMKRYESKINHILSSNTGLKDESCLVKNNKLPFSTGYVSISIKTMNHQKLSFLNSKKISRVIFSETKANLILTIHKAVQSACGKKSVICLWDLTVTREEPIKILTAIDDVVIGRFRGNNDGVFVAALEDGSLHLWDLSEELICPGDGGSEKKSTDLVEVQTETLTEFEQDREWNLRNSHVGFDQTCSEIGLQSCAFTSSAGNMTAKEDVGHIVGLEINTDTGHLDSGRRIVGQIITLQRIGILTVWSIIQDKLKLTYDIGKAILSKMKLEKSQTIRLTEQIDISSKHIVNSENFAFNLNAAKRRISLRKKEKSVFKNISRPQSAMSTKFDFDFDRPSSAASMRKQVMPLEIIEPKNWETGVLCTDLKIIRVNNIENYLVAKNCGEVLCCTRCFGALKTKRFTVATDTSSVTNLEVSSNGLPYFLAATDLGTVHLCSLLDNRVLLTLDCRNLPTPDLLDKCQADNKGRFISSVTTRRPSEDIVKPTTKLEIKSLHWSPVNPCSIYVVLQDTTIVMFELTHSDIYAKYVCEKAAVACASNDVNLALLTPDDEVQVHRLSNDLQTKQNLNVFEKYVALL